jgi:hypothetical protein
MIPSSKKLFHYSCTKAGPHSIAAISGYRSDGGGHWDGMSFSFFEEDEENGPIGFQKPMML